MTVRYPDASSNLNSNCDLISSPTLFDQGRCPIYIDLISNPSHAYLTQRIGFAAQKSFQQGSRPEKDELTAF
jgi:hypothetical protein